MSSSRKWFLILLAAGGSLVVGIAAHLGRLRPRVRSVGRPGQRALPRGTPPDASFAGVTSGNEQVDAFVGHFIGLCRRGDYEQYRLCWTAYGTPISGERLPVHVEIRPQGGHHPDRPFPETAKAMQPAYLIRASVQLDPKAKITGKDVELMVQWEDNRWAITPAPHWSRPPESQPATDTDPAG